MGYHTSTPNHVEGTSIHLSVTVQSLDELSDLHLIYCSLYIVGKYYSYYSYFKSHKEFLKLCLAVTSIVSD